MSKLNPLGELWYLPGSPWSVRTCWALDLCGFHVNQRQYRPMLDQPLLWFRLGCPLSGKPTSVPVLFLSGGTASPVRESDDIAEHADTKAGAQGPQLFPEQYRVSIRSVCARADVILSYGRGVYLKYLQENPDAAAGIFLPPFLRGKPFSSWIAAKGLNAFASKYPPPPRDLAIEALESFHDILRKSHSIYMFGDALSYADITAACAIFFAVKRNLVSTISKELEEQFKDLVSWRNAIFEKHYPGDAQSAFQLQGTHWANDMPEWGRKPGPFASAQVHIRIRFQSMEYLIALLNETSSVPAAILSCSSWCVYL